MSTVRQNFAQYLQSLRIMFFSLLGGAGLMLAIMYLIPPEDGETSPASGLEMYIPLVVLALLVVAFFLGRSRIEAARSLQTLKEKMTAYRTALIMRWAMLEGSGLLAGVFFFLTRDMLLLAVAGMCLVVMALFMPSRERIIADLELSGSEQAALDDPNVIVAEMEGRGR